MVRSRSLLTHGLLGGLAFVMLFPVVWTVTTSLKPANELYGAGPFGDHVTLDSYRRALDALPLVRLLVNTTLMAVGVTVGQVLVSIMAAYAFTRFTFRGRSIAFAAAVGTVLVPQQCLIIPQYLLAAELGILDDYLGLTLPQIATCAVGIVLLHHHMRALPEALFDAARLDGATDREVLWRVVVPNLRPAITALSIVSFIGAWNEYVWPLLATRGTDLATVQVGLQAFQGEQGTSWGPLLAAASMSTLPVLLLYTLAQRRIIDAFLQTGLR